jgi:hypothetical protein
MGRGQSAETLMMKAHILRIIEKLEDWLPVTVRQVFYQLVKALIIENIIGQYKRVSRMMSEMRYDGELEWWKVEDRSRRTIIIKKWTNLGECLEEKVNDLDYYFRCKVQQQENYVEVWTEKDALTGIFQRVILPYCVKLVVCRGQSSTTYVKNYADRATAAIERGQQPVIIYGGDLDPTGMRVPISIEERLRDHHDIDVTMHRFGLNPEQIEEYNLPFSIEAIKDKDPNTPKYIKKYGRIAVELDSLDPSDLEYLIDEALLKFIDMEGYEEEVKIEKKERKVLGRIKGKIMQVIEEERRAGTF